MFVQNLSQLKPIIGQCLSEGNPKEFEKSTRNPSKKKNPAI